MLMMRKGIDDVNPPAYFTDFEGFAVAGKPLFGTAARHATCLFPAWGDANTNDAAPGSKANEGPGPSGNTPETLKPQSSHLAKRFSER